MNKNSNPIIYAIILIIGIYLGQNYIQISTEKNDKIDSSISNNLSYICGETLANSLNIVDVLENDKISVDLVDDISVNISIKKI